VFCDSDDTHSQPPVIERHTGDANAVIAHLDEI
jgi:hypothetical protein